MQFGRIGRKLIEANFEGGEIGSDGGLMLLRQTDQIIGLTVAAANDIIDRRDGNRIEDPMRTLFSQRILALSAGYEDLNDHQALRQDGLAANRCRTRASSGQRPHAVSA